MGAWLAFAILVSFVAIGDRARLCAITRERGRPAKPAA
jgi:hypothetical protein